MKYLEYADSYVWVLKSPDPATVRAYPCDAVTHAPHVFLQAVVTDLKAAGAVPTEWELPSTGMALEVPFRAGC
ncbi:MAG: hypothetical protein ACUVQ6_04645 [Dissulfurimicrobium sp.]|uniref:hypothetical protein n=1 Tax=Dissulfurimicrobium sp. TaxID=2022436 RepID=UPI00404B1567